MHKKKQVQNAFAWIVNELKGSFLFSCIRLLKNCLMKIILIPFFKLGIDALQKIVSLCFFANKISWPQDSAATSLPFQQSSHFKFVFHPRNVTWGITQSKILLNSQKDVSMYMGLCRINPETLLHVTKFPSFFAGGWTRHFLLSFEDNKKKNGICT